MSAKRSAADVAVQGAANQAILELALEPMRSAARSRGYAVAVHGSLTCDIDLIAIPWTEHAAGPDELLETVTGAVAAMLGSCWWHKARKGRRKGLREWTDKPHGRRVAAFYANVGGAHVHFDFGVMPLILKEPKQ